MAPAATSTHSPGSHLAGLDGVRGMAILLVILWHYLIDQRASGAEATLLAVRLLRWTWAGVDLFFVLSGFLIARNLLEAPSTREAIATFFIRRIARLLPLYLVVLATYGLARPFLDGWNTGVSSWLAGDVPVRGLWLYPVFLQNFAIAASGTWPGQWLAPSWSLAVEVQFYLVAPLVMLATPRRHLLPVLLALAAASLVSRCVVVALTQQALAAHVLFPFRADAFCIGAAVAVLTLNSGREAWLRAHVGDFKRRFWLGLTALTTMSAFGVVIFSMPMATFGYTFLAVTAAHLILIALYADAGNWRKILTHPALRFVGMRSFGLYLIHQPVRGLMAMGLGDTGLLDPMSPWLALLAFGVTLMLTAISWRWIECPLIEYGRRVTIGSRVVAKPSLPAATS